MRTVTPLLDPLRKWAAQRQFTAFLVAAGSSVPVNLLSRVLFSEWVPYGVAVLLAHGVGMVTAYTLSRQFVFEQTGRSVASELGRFAAVNVVSATLTWAVSVSLVDFAFPAVHFTLQPELIGHVLGLAVASLTSFVGHRHFSFGKSASLS